MESMTIEEIRSNLCSYDPRNPNYYYDEEWNIGHKEPPTKCSCDNCFYGRTKMANYIIQLLEQYEKNLKDAWEMGSAHGTAEDDVLPEAVEAQKQFLARVLTVGASSDSEKI
jgi:hypothetical protein